MKSIQGMSKVVVASAVLFVGSTPARGAIDTWNVATGGLFSTAGNWTPGGPPGAADTAVFDLNNTYTVTFISDVTNTLCQVGNGTVTFALGGATYTQTASAGMTVGNVPAQTGRLTLTNGTVSGDLAIGTLGTGSLTISSDAVFNTGSNSIEIGSSNVGTMTVSSGGTYTGTSTVNIGNSSFSNGTLTVTGGGSSFASGTLNVANNGIGDATISSGGTASTTSVNVGNLSGSTGSLTVTGSGSSLSTGGNSLTVGSSGEGHMTISSGGTVTSGFVTIGFQPNSSGDVTITGSGSVWNVSGGLTVASLGTGCSLSVISGGTLSSGIGVIGSGSGSSGSVSLSGSGSAWNCTGQLFVGSTGTGNLTVSTGATLTTSNTLTVTASTGTMTISGGTVDVGTQFIRNGVFNFNDGTLIVHGIYDNGTSAGPLTIDGNTSTALPTLELNGNSASNDITSLTVGNSRQGALILSGNRSLSTGANHISIGAAASANGTITLGPGTSLSTDAAHNVFVGGQLSGAGGGGVLTIGNAATLSTGTLVNYPGGTVNLNGGTASINSYSDFGGVFNWTGGTLQFGLNTGLSDTTLTRLLGGTHSLIGGQILSGGTGVALTVNGATNVSGGTLISPTITNNATLTLNSGSVSATTGTFTNSAGAVTLVQGTAVLSGSNITNGGTLQLASTTATVSSAGTLTNNGTISGTGILTSAVQNNAAGSIQVTTGQKLVFGGTVTDSGSMSLVGGEMQFGATATTSANTGIISGRDAILRFNGGLTNNGALAFSNGTMDIFGDITNNMGGLITVSGGGTTTFYDDVTIAAGASNVRATAVGSSVSKVVFFGSYNGGIAGGGTAFIEGDHRPGNSPATVAFGGDAAYGGLSRLFIEIGGTSPGSQFDQVHVNGQLALDGTLNVSLINSFSPAIGNSFDILDWTTLSGTFSTFELQPLTGKAWDTSQLYTNGTLFVVPNRGDINRDTHVDIADVSALMTALADLPTYQGSLTNEQLAEIADLTNDNLINNKDVQGLIVALANGGGSAAGATGSASAVPEPASLTLLVIASAAAAVIRQRRNAHQSDRRSTAFSRTTGN